MGTDKNDESFVDEMMWSDASGDDNWKLLLIPPFLIDRFVEMNLDPSEMFYVSISW